MAKRKKNWSVLCVGITACFSFYTQICFSQTIQTITDKKDILIGEQIQLKIKTVFPIGQLNLSKWVTLPDSISHFDIVETGKVDTIAYKDNSNSFEQTITLTSFDSGRWVFPSLPVELADATGKPVQELMTDSFIVNVSYSPPDSTNQLRDIKPIIKVSITDYTWYYIAGGIVLLLLITLILYRYFKKNKKLKPAGPISKLSPYDEAMGEINKLAQYDLQNAEAIKIYHTKLSDIFKRYLGRKQNKNLANSTTSDLLINMANSKFIPENISTLAMALRSNDAVKFAKYIPMALESEDCKLKIKETINLIEQQIYPPKL
ncbi:MAG: hypothetical protein ABI666_06375 [Ferruginibacter sp.]